MLNSEQKTAAVEMLCKKAGIYAAGCEKRGKLHEMTVYQNLAHTYQRKPKED
jgi:hypothetical protein